MNVCSICGGTVFTQVRLGNGPTTPLCAAHYIELRRVENERNRNLIDQTHVAMAAANEASAMMDMMTGYISPSPRFAIPAPAPAVHHTAVSVVGDVGVLNTGTANQIIANLGAMRGHDDARAALQQLTAAILADSTLDAETKRGALDQLEVITQQAALPPGQRKSAVVLPLLDGIAKLATTAHAVAAAWAVAEPLVHKLFI